MRLRTVVSSRDFFPNEINTAYVCQKDPIMALMPNATCMRDFGGLYQVQPPFSERKSTDDHEEPCPASLPDAAKE